MSILALAKLPLVFVGGAVSVLAAIGSIHISASLSIIEAIIKIILSLFFSVVLGLGLYGIAAGTLVATLLVRAFWTPFLAIKKCQIKIPDILLQFLLPCTIVGIVFFLLCEFIQRSLIPNTWITFSIDVFIVLILYFMFGVPVLMPREYLGSIYKKIRN